MNGPFVLRYLPQSHIRDGRFTSTGRPSSGLISILPGCGPSRCNKHFIGNKLFIGNSDASLPVIRPAQRDAPLPYKSGIYNTETLKCCVPQMWSSTPPCRCSRRDQCACPTATGFKRRCVIAATVTCAVLSAFSRKIFAPQPRRVDMQRDRWSVRSVLDAVEPYGVVGVRGGRRVCQPEWLHVEHTQLTARADGTRRVLELRRHKVLTPAPRTRARRPQPALPSTRSHRGSGSSSWRRVASTSAAPSISSDECITLRVYLLGSSVSQCT